MAVTRKPDRIVSAREAGLVACKRCARVWPANQEECARCGKELSSRDWMSLQRVWAWWIAGVLAYIPAMMYPMLATRTLLSSSESTIVGGAIDLLMHGAPAVAIIVLFASVMIPLGKFVAIAYLAWAVGHPDTLHARRRYVLYEVVEFIGRWSMIDVFVVAILASLVQLSFVVSISPGPASLAFALSVIFTMLSAQSFDSRMIWDRERHA